MEWSAGPYDDKEPSILLLGVSRGLASLNKISFYYPAISEATCTWSGQLAPRMIKNPPYSCKVFVGGIPWDITEGKNTLIFL